MADIKTRGGCTFLELCKGSDSYACDNTVDISDAGTVEKARDRVILHIGDILTVLKHERGREIIQFYIGKTSIHGQKIRGKDAVREVDPKDQRTWKKDGISKRWCRHHSRPLCADGMVVLAVVTSDTFPGRLVSKEQAAFALEEQLLHRFCIDQSDDRCVNKGFAQGSSDDDESPAYAVYMAFKH